jgi:hypothetical protein
MLLNEKWLEKVKWRNACINLVTKLPGKSPQEERPYSKCGDNIKICLKGTECGDVEKLKVKVKLSLCVTKHHAMKTYWGSGL